MILNKNNFFSNFIYFNKNSNNIIFNLNLKNFNILIKFYLRKKPNIIMFCNSLDFRYSWSKTSEIPSDFGSVDINFFFSTKTNNPKKFFNVNENSAYLNSNQIVIFKKKTSMFKKVFDIDYVVLNKINDYKNNTDTNFLNGFNYYKKNFYDKNISTKTIDFKKKFKLLFNLNRKILKNLFYIKKRKQHALTRKIKHICNSSKSQNVINLENSCLNIIMNSDFFFSIKDCNWFFSKGLIFLNSKIITNSKVIIKPYDIIQISLGNTYYNFYKNYLNFLIINSYKISSRVWFINKNRHEKAYFKGVKDIVSNESYPKYFENYKYFKKDVPLNLEVDYISMTIILLYNNKKVKQFNFFNFKFFNFYLNRLYNWKYIT